MPIARRTEAAEVDLQDIAYHIAIESHSPFAADRIIDELTAKCGELARDSQFVQQGTSAPEIGERVRLFSYKRWVILFRYEPHGIDVLRFADGSQDYLSWKL
jgi:plasmid stabilization system protein ParE